MSFRLKSLLSRLWIVFVLIGLSWYLTENADDIRELITGVTVPSLLGSFALIFIGKIAAFFLMIQSLGSQVGKLPSFRELLWIYSSSDVAKYAPGGVWPILGRIGFMKAMHLDSKQIAKTFLLENLGFGFSALLVALPAFVLLWPMPSQFGSNSFLKYSVLGIGLIGIGVGSKLIFKRLIGGAGRSTKNDILVATGAMGIGWLSIGSAFFLLLPGEYGLLQWFWTSSAYSTSFVAGMAAFFAPAGFGVREAVLVILGNAIRIDSNALLTAALISRGVWLAVDLSFFIAAAIVRRTPK